MDEIGGSNISELTLHIETKSSDDSWHKVDNNN